MSVKCIIAEDEPIGRNILQTYIRRDPRLELTGSCKTAPEAIACLKASPVDLLFLDIQLPEVSGLQLLRSLPVAPLVIFTTAFREYALDAFELNAIDYLLKPFSFERFRLAVDKALRFPGTQMDKTSFFIRDGSRFIQLSPEDILYIEALREYVKIVTTTQSYIVHQTMKGLEEKLPDTLFVRIHKSYIVAIRKISAIEGGTVVLGKDRLPISRQDRNSILEKITKNRLIG